MSLATAKRPRPSAGTPMATHSFNVAKRPRPGNPPSTENSLCPDNASKHPTLASTYSPLTLRPQFKANSRPSSQLPVELPPVPSLTFLGLSPIISFLTFFTHNSFNPPLSAGPGGVGHSDRCGIQDEHLYHSIIQGVNYGVYPRNDVPYSMLHDNVTPGSELHSYELMRKLTKDRSPSFLPITLPVQNALDLGYGNGHWVAHAAQVWGANGTKITGINIPLSTNKEKALLPGQGTENVKLLCHNFITEQLPFSDNTFDYVRLNSAVTTIPGERWDFVLSEVHRVLSPGGRLELIHDQLCFSSLGPETPVSCTFTPSKSQHDSHFNIREAAKGMALPRSKKSPYEDWEAEMRNCGDVERLYLDMLARRYGVHPQPGTILANAIQRRFGSKTMIKASNVHVCLPSQDFMTRSRVGPPPKKAPKKREFGISITIDWGPDKPSKTFGKLPTAPPAPPPAESLSLTSLPPVLSKKAASLMGVAQLSPVGAPYQPPGVIVVHTSSRGTSHPMTFLPMSPTELDMHSNKHVDSLLSAKHALEAHTEELRRQGKPPMLREGLDDALWRYATFRRKRFNWPEMDLFEWDSESESDGESGVEQTRHVTLPDTQTTDGLTPIRLFEILEVIKSTPMRSHTWSRW